LSAKRGSCRQSRALLMLLAECLLLGFGALPAGAVIQRLYPLAGIIGDSQSIATGTIQRVRPPNEISVGRVSALKGKVPFDGLVVTLSAQPASQNGTFLGLIRVGQRMVLFQATAMGKPVVLAYIDGAWMRFEPSSAKGVWRFAHFEPYLRRSYHGSAANLASIVANVVRGKRRAPDPDPHVKPGVGVSQPADYLHAVLASAARLFGAPFGYI